MIDAQKRRFGDWSGRAFADCLEAILPELVRLLAFAHRREQRLFKDKMYRKKRRGDCLGVRVLARLMRRVRNFGTLFHEAFAFGAHSAFSILPPFAYLSTNEHTPILLRFAEIGRGEGGRMRGAFDQKPTP